MNLTCTTKGKFANLTANKNYEGIEDGELYVVVNDIGARARYAKKYFREVRENVAAAVPAPPPPPPAPVNILDMVTRNIVVTGQDASIRLTAGRGVAGLEQRLTINGSSISCGIHQLSGINGYAAAIARWFTGLNRTNVTGNVQDLVNAIMSELFAQLKASNAISAAFMLLSDREDESDLVQNWLSENCEYSTTELNPNSNHNITLWVYNLRTE